ncbi:hypothetical protein HG537_0D01520 [Torulaspora globosa]|uniref:M-phase inducer phosphatase n=1 Tax=Torulaspora globosa TaxID=48254 RepID=A0A7H9HS72_9SACH|nr:hypothetical protein HG537_0D01520 [Torulaspora sp. CBS 2947]
MKILAEHESGEREITIFRTMALGHSFKSERNIFKNIHSLLKKPKKREGNHEVSDQQRLNSEYEYLPSFDTSPASIGTTKQSVALGKCLGSTSPTPRKELESRPSAVSPTISRCHSNEPSLRSPNGIEVDEDDIFLHNLLPPQLVRSHPQRKASHNSISSGSSRTTRPANAVISKREGKSLRGSRASLHRMNSIGHRDIVPAQQEELQPSTPARKAYHSMISESGIPHYNHDGSAGDHFPRISAETLKSIIEDGIYKSHYDSYQVVDCRFEYEFKGGHICNALNISSREDLEKEFIHTDPKMTALLIFHCEFSSYRGPILASHLRNCDRMLNHENYPALFYPDILVLDGGYKGFFDKFPSLCFPRRYVGMDSSENLASRDQELDRFRYDSKKMLSRNSSLHKLTSVSSRSSIKQSHREKNSCSSRPEYSASNSFKYEAPPKLSISRYSNDNLFGNSDDSSSASRLSINSSPNLSTSRMLLMDGLDGDSCYSFEEEDSTFTTPVAIVSTPINKQNESGNVTETSTLNPIKKSLFNNVLREEEEEI